MKRRNKKAEAAEKFQDARMPPVPVTKRANVSRNGIGVFSSIVFLSAFALVMAITWSFMTAGTIILALFVGVVAAWAIRIVPQWESCVVLRLGRFHRCAGPGLFFVIPFFEYVAARVDQRIIATPFVAEEALTADLVPLDIDAVLFWMVWNPRSACVEVEDYPSAVWWAAQTALRDAIGRINLAEVATRRNQVDNEIKDVLDATMRDWGITVVSVEIRDISIPKELQDAMSREAQAERERNARLILAEVEKDISEMFVEAASVYETSDKAMQLRTMNLIYESVKEKGGLVIAPSAFGEAFNNIDSFLGK